MEKMLRAWLTGIMLWIPTAAITIPYRPPPAEILKAERITSNTTLSVPRPNALLAAPPAGGPISRTGWTVTVDSFEPGTEGAKVLDGDANSMWHTARSTAKPLPHTITIDMKRVYNVNGLTYLPRQDGSSDGNIGQHQIFLSTDGRDFGSPVALGAYLDDRSEKVTAFETKPAQYVRIVALTEAGGRGPWTSAAEINVYAANSFTTPAKGLGRWGPTIDFPIVPVAAAIEFETGRVLTWSAFSPSSFVGGNGGMTVTATYDPSSRTVSQRTVSNTNHDMFCPGISIDGKGRLIVTGGNNAPRTSIRDPGSDTWAVGPDMRIARGYQSSATCSDGRVFTIGGSWSGGEGGKNGEIYDLNANTWTLLPGTPVAPMLTADFAGVFRSDNHAWLFGWKRGSVFQAGPSKAMNWYGTSGTGSQTGVGNRAADGDAMCGNAVMYDAVGGKILTAGGSPNYEGTQASGNAYVITVGEPNNRPTVEAVSSMAYPRTFANAVVLPDGQVFINGGQTVGRPFSDDGATLTPEMWDPGSRRFRSLLPNSIPRTYHSVSLLMLDGTVFTGGGGLCDTCSTNHFDAQIYTPPYLLNDDGSLRSRPVINSVSAKSVSVGGTLTVNTNSAIASMSLIRYGSVTHALNTDQRRIPLTPRPAGTNTYTVTIPTDPGIALPGYWMLFAIDSAGVPSVAKTVFIRGS
jgi:galactose oxidase